jgi:hypothetical protein
LISPIRNSTVNVYQLARNSLLSDISSTKKEIQNFSEMTNLIISGPANDTFINFIVYQRTYGKQKIRTGYSCILDGDMKEEKRSNGSLMFPSDEQF